MGGKKRDARLHTIRGRRVRKVVLRDEKGRRGEGAKKVELRVMRSVQHC
jgi:hypothetical protein